MLVLRYSDILRTLARTHEFDPAMKIDKDYRTMQDHRRLSKLPRSVLAGTVILLISSCASIDKNDCLEGNWTSVGQTDGANGRVASSRLVSHTEACGKHGVQPNQSQYMDGYAQGITRYCTTENGYTIGSKFRQHSHNRNGYKSVCPADIELGYLRGYIKGLKNNLGNQRRDLIAQEEDLRGQETAALLLDAVKSSKADKQDRKAKRAKTAVLSTRSAVQDISHEIEKWLVAKPELTNN